MVLHLYDLSFWQVFRYFKSYHDETSQTPESMVSIEETCEADKETECFLASLAFSRVMKVTPGGTEYGPGKEEEEVR